MYTDAELEAMIDSGESDLVEFKESWNGDAPKKGREAICAFLNDLPDHRKAGVLFVGVKDDGTPSNLPITDELLRTLAGIQTDSQILPPPTIVVEKRFLKGADVAVVIAEPAQAPPVRFQGRILVRVGPTRAVATAQAEYILRERGRRVIDPPFDARPVFSSNITDLNRLRFELEYLPNAFSPDILKENNRTYEQRLASCNMILSVDEPVPTGLGLLVLSDNPKKHIGGAYIQFLRIHGDDLLNGVIDEEAITGPLSFMLKRIEEKLTLHNMTAIDISGPREKRSNDYPIAALRQLVHNAVMHNAYDLGNAPIHVYWYDDRIEITNSGGPFGKVSIQNFGTEGLVDYRNQLLADAMKTLGFAQRFGFGLMIARQELEKNNNPPAEFKLDPAYVRCTVRKKRTP